MCACMCVWSTVYSVCRRSPPSFPLGLENHLDDSNNRKPCLDSVNSLLRLDHLLSNTRGDVGKVCEWNVVNEQ